MWVTLAPGSQPVLLHISCAPSLLSLSHVSPLPPQKTWVPEAGSFSPYLLLYNDLHQIPNSWKQRSDFCGLEIQEQRGREALWSPEVSLSQM